MFFPSLLIFLGIRRQLLDRERKKFSFPFSVITVCFPLSLPLSAPIILVLLEEM
jgi:hypothetical protein